MTALLVLGLVGAATLTYRARHYSERADQELRTVALGAGFTAADNVHVRYPFLIERLGLTSRNEEPSPYGYAGLDLELAVRPLRTVFASPVPDTRSWLPHPVSVRNVRFDYHYAETTTDASFGTFMRVEFKDAAQLLARLQSRHGPAGARAVLCRTLSEGQQSRHLTGSWRR